MSSETFNLKDRIKPSNAVWGTRKEQQALGAPLSSAKGDWTKALDNLKKKLPADALQKVTLEFPGDLGGRPCTGGESPLKIQGLALCAHGASVAWSEHESQHVAAHWKQTLGLLRRLPQ